MFQSHPLLFCCMWENIQWQKNVCVKSNQIILIFCWRYEIALFYHLISGLFDMDCSIHQSEVSTQCICCFGKIRCLWLLFQFSHTPAQIAQVEFFVIKLCPSTGLHWLGDTYGSLWIICLSSFSVSVHPALTSWNIGRGHICSSKHDL